MLSPTEMQRRVNNMHKTYKKCNTNSAHNSQLISNSYKEKSKVSSAGIYI